MVKGWSYKHIGDLVNILNGGTPSTRVSKYWNGDINWCTPSDITKQSTKYIFSTERTITKEGLSDSGAVFLPKGTILLCTRATIGESSIAGDQICTNQGFKNLVCIAVDNEFLYYALKPLKNEMISNAHGSTFLELSKLHLEKIEVFIPNDRDEQHNIAEALSDIDELIYSLEMLIKKKKAIRKGAIQELITGKKRLHGFSEPWVEIKLSDAFSEFIVPMRDKPKSLIGEIPWCRIEDFDGKYLSQSKTGQGVSTQTIAEMNLKVLPIGSLIVSCSANLGKCAIIISELVTNQTFIGMVPKPETDVEFFFYKMSAEQARLNDKATGTTIAYLSREEFENYRAFVPPTKDEQKAISSILSDMDSEIENITKKVNKYKLIKIAMMDELLTGKIRLV